MNTIEENHIVSNTEIETNQNFIELSISFLNDNELSEEEKIQLNELLDSYKKEKGEIFNESINNIFEIKNEIELKKIISQTEDYKNSIEEFSKLSRNEIRNIQHIVGTPSDGIFGINSYISYKNSPISGVFSPIEISKGRRVGENVKGFIENFPNLNGVDTQIMAIILSDNISSDTYLFLDEDGNITVFNNNQELIKFSVSDSLEGLLHESFIKKDLSIITKQLSLIPNQNDKRNYITTLRDIIEKYNYQKEARDIFTKNTSRGIEINLPDISLNRDIKAVDLFGDSQQLTINGEKYINNGEEFFTQNGKRLAIFNRQVLNIENYNTQKTQIEESAGIQESKTPQKNQENIIQEAGISQEQINEDIERNLSKEFGNWLVTEGSKLLGKTGPKSCGKAVSLLINTFMRSKGIIDGLNINFARNGANFDSILEQGNISEENPFIIKYRDTTKKITSEAELVSEGLDISNILHRRLEVKSRNIDFPKESVAGEIIVFNEGAELESLKDEKNQYRIKYGHVEIRGPDNKYYSFYKSLNPGGSTSRVDQEGDPREYARLTGFTGKAYRIEMKS